MPTWIGKPKQKSPIEQQAERESQHVAEVYVNRRKVGEYRAESEDAAMSQARTAKAKYQGERVEIRMREAPRSK